MGQSENVECNCRDGLSEHSDQGSEDSADE